MKKTDLRSLTAEILAEEAILKEGGGAEGKERQKCLGRMTVRERLSHLLDDSSNFLELGIWAAYGMYQEWGKLPSAGLVAGIGTISNRVCMVIANDATVKAGAMFPQSVKKILRAQKIAFKCRLPIIYLVDSSGVFLPLQEDIFPDEDDFGRIFRNNAVFSAAGIPQYAAIMGNCIAGGGYLPVLCDKLLMTEGSGLYLAGPALVKAAIGQKVDPEELGGVRMHAELSGTVDFYEPEDKTCLQRLRSLVALLPADSNSILESESEMSSEQIYSLYNDQKGYDVREILKCIFDRDSLIEYKASYGKTIVTSFAKIGGMPVGVVANQRLSVKNGKGEIEIGGVIYCESADKAARFVMDCNQMKIPLIFFQDVMGFMVGKEAEQSGIIKSGAKLVNAVSNSIVPKITVIIGNSFGAGNYALCGKAYDPEFIFSWPNAKYAVMGAEQAAETLYTIQLRAAERRGEKPEKLIKMREEIVNTYAAQMDIRYGAARGWVDAIIPPHETREVLKKCVLWASRSPRSELLHTGVFQV